MLHGFQKLVWWEVRVSAIYQKNGDSAVARIKCVEDFQFSITVGVVGSRENPINAKLLQNLVHEAILESVPLSDKMYHGHMCTGKYSVIKVVTIVSADLSGMGNASGHPVK